MTHEYQVSGMTCDGCVAKVKGMLESLPDVLSADVNRNGKVLVTMSRHIETADLQSALQDFPQYQLSSAVANAPMPYHEEIDPERTFLETYKPILLVFAYILGATLLTEAAAGVFDWMRWMRHFMAGFFLVFSFFKMLDIPAFAASYSSYDAVARRWFGWGYVYPFIELLLGVLFLLNFNPLVTNILAFVLMGLGTIGVVQSLMEKRKFQCACLGAVFNLPMSRITLFEDVLMMAMSGLMLFMYL